MQFASLYDAASKYANLGLAVFPLYPKSKRPATKHGCKDATTDGAQIKAWWQENPNYNIGIATGRVSGGLFVIDLDIDENKGIDGYHSLNDWCRKYGEFPDTWTSITGRGGYHLFFKSKDEIQNRTGVIEGVDIRGDGGYVVAPPSMHENGKEYEWEYDPEDIQLAGCTDTIKFFLNIGKSDTHSTFHAPDRIPSGERNATLFKFACMMQAKGASDQAVYAATKAENESKCDVPISDEELKLLVNNVVKNYEKGKPVYFDTSGNAIQGEHEPFFQTSPDGKILQTIANCAEAIEFDPGLYGKIKYNELSYSPFVCGELPWDRSETYREWSNSDDSNLKSYIEKTYGLKSMNKIDEAFKMVVIRNKFNPVIDMLEYVYRNEWDGSTGNIKKLLPEYLGVEDTEYTEEVMKIFMLGAICRVYYPGCKFDYMPVLLGDQGIGKSTFARYLSMNNSWYNDNFNTVDGDKAAEKLRGMWMVEMAELLATKRAKEVESIKAFLTSTADNYREPYARRTELRKRVCVFIGTTNNNQFLTDQTGNRRFLPLIARKDFCKKSLFNDMDNVMKDFKNAWGEAMDLFYKANKKPELVLPEHIQSYAEKMQSSHMEEDSRIGVIQNWLNLLEEEVDRVCTAMIYQKALGYGDSQIPDRRTNRDLHDIMQNSIVGWKKYDGTGDGRAHCGSYGKQVCYVRIDSSGRYGR